MATGNAIVACSAIALNARACVFARYSVTNRAPSTPDSGRQATVVARRRCDAECDSAEICALFDEGA